MPGKGDVCSQSRSAYQRLLLGLVGGECCCKAVGALLQGEGSGWGWQCSPNTLCLAFAAESSPRSLAVPSSPPALILSEAPQPPSVEALAPALQQLDLAAPAMLQVRTMSVPQFPHPQRARI